jgi:hypothetical protein
MIGCFFSQSDYDFAHASFAHIEFRQQGHCALADRRLDQSVFFVAPSRLGHHPLGPDTGPLVGQQQRFSSARQLVDAQGHARRHSQRGMGDFYRLVGGHLATLGCFAITFDQ